MKLLLRVSVVLAVVLPAASCLPAQEATTLRGPYFGQLPPGENPVLFAPEFLREPGEYHATVVFSPDGTEAFWSPMPGHGRNTTLVSHLVDGVWTTPQYTDFGLDAGVTEVTLSPDGSRIFFLSRQRLEGERPGTANRDSPERIWYAPRTPDGVGTPRLMPETITSLPTHWQFSVAATGNLYFSSRGAAPAGTGDIYVARLVDGAYVDAQPLGPTINSGIAETCPFVAPDESYLIFTRHDRNNYNPDLFISYRGHDGSWTEARRLPSPINSEDTEIYPVVSSDEKYFFFLSWREGAGRIFWMDAGFIRAGTPR